MSVCVRYATNTQMLGGINARSAPYLNSTFKPFRLHTYAERERERGAKNAAHVGMLAVSCVYMLELIH